MQSHPGGYEKLHPGCGEDLSYKPCKPPPIKPPSCQWLIAAKTVPGTKNWGMRSCTAWRRICPWKAMMVTSWEPIASCLSASWKEKIEDVRNSHSWQKFNLCRQQKHYATEIWHRCQKWWEKVSGFKHGYSGVSMLNFGGGVVSLSSRWGIVTQICVVQISYFYFPSQVTKVWWVYPL